MAEINRVIDQVKRQCSHAQIIMGAAVDAAMEDKLCVTVIAARPEAASRPEAADRNAHRRAGPAVSATPWWRAPCGAKKAGAKRRADPTAADHRVQGPVRQERTHQAQRRRSRRADLHPPRHGAELKRNGVRLREYGVRFGSHA